MRVVISIQPSDFICSALNVSLFGLPEALKGAATPERKISNKREYFTRSALSIILVEVGPVEIPDFEQVGLL